VRVVDLGTGSGAIALSVAVEAGPRVAAAGLRLEVWATDASPRALALAATNRDRLVRPEGAGRAATVALAEGSWWRALDPGLVGTLDVVVANPPYVGTDELPTLDPAVREWEPHEALVAPAGPSGVDGTADLEALVAGAPGWLRPGGALILELAPAQGEAMVAAATAAGLIEARVAEDLAGRPRTLLARRP
jgi:release factor glutamine methyltransferase